jgi:hypothetical protein
MIIAYLPLFFNTEQNDNLSPLAVN